MAAGEVHHLPDLGFGDLEGEHADHREPALVHRQHEVERLRVRHAEEPLQHMNDELHRRVVVVEQHHLVERRTLGLGPGLGDHTGIAVAGAGLAGHQEGTRVGQGVTLSLEGLTGLLGA